MKLESYRVEPVGTQVWTLTIDPVDMVRAKLDGFDRALLADCSKEDATIADKLLALETLARRVEEWHAASTK